MSTVGSRAIFATQSCLTEFNGQAVQVHQGEAWDADDPFVKERPDLFDTPGNLRRTPGFEPDAPKIERGTRAPGERRGPGRPRKDSY